MPQTIILKESILHQAPRVIEKEDGIWLVCPNLLIRLDPLGPIAKEQLKNAVQRQKLIDAVLAS